MRIYLLCLSLVSCAKAEVMEPKNEIPSDLERAVQFQDDDGATGWAAPFQLERLVTVAHLMDEPGGRWVTKDGNSGPATVMWKDKKRDIAVLQADDTERHLFPLVRFATKEPAPLTTLYYRYFLIGGRAVYGKGTYIGIDADGDISLDAATYPGSSGSPVMDSQGRVYGLISRGWNQAGSMPDSPTIMDALQILNRRSMFRASVVVTPLIGGIPPRPKDE